MKIAEGGLRTAQGDLRTTQDDLRTTQSDHHSRGTITSLESLAHA